MNEIRRYLRGIKDLAIGYGVVQGLGIAGVIAGLYSWVLIGSLFV